MIGKVYRMQDGIANAAFNFFKSIAQRNCTVNLGKALGRCYWINVAMGKWSYWKGT